MAQVGSDDNTNPWHFSCSSSLMMRFYRVCGAWQCHALPGLAYRACSKDKLSTMGTQCTLNAHSNLNCTADTLGFARHVEL